MRRSRSFPVLCDDGRVRRATWTAASADPAPWTDAVPFDRPARPEPGWSIAADGMLRADEATAIAARYRSHGRAAVVTRYLSRALSGGTAVAYRVTVDIAPTDAAWAAYRGE